MLAERIREVPVGQVVEVLADDPAAKTDLPAWCALKSQEFVGAAELAPSRLVVPGPPQLLILVRGLRLDGWNRPAKRGSAPTTARASCSAWARLSGLVQPGLSSRSRPARLCGVQLGVDDACASASSSLIIWISWAARNGSPTMSPRIHSTPPPSTWSVARLGPHGRASAW